VPGAGLRGDGDGCRRHAIELRPVGAITAKGGRLTPPEGGSGPEYKLT